MQYILPATTPAVRPLRAEGIAVLPAQLFATGSNSSFVDNETPSRPPTAYNLPLITPTPNPKRAGGIAVVAVHVSPCHP
jgi:hypothetical protein